MALPVLLRPFVYDLASIGRKARVPFDPGSGGERHDFQRRLGTAGPSGRPPPAGEQRDGGSQNCRCCPGFRAARGRMQAGGTTGAGIFLKIADREPYIVDRLKSPARILAQTPVNDLDRKSTRLNSSHLVISYAVFCLK